MSITAVLHSSELLQLEKILIERSNNRFEHITQAGLAAAAHLRNICSGRPLHFFVAAGRKGVIALTAAIELHQSDNDIDLVISLIGEKNLDEDSVFGEVFSRVPDKLLVRKGPKTRAVLIDGMYGFDHSLEASQHRQLGRIAAYRNAKIAIEAPSGVEVDTGKSAELALKCDSTIAFIMPLVCHMLLPGRSLCGTVHVCDVGAEEYLDKIRPEYSCNAAPDFSDILPDPSDNKYSRGATAVIASRIMPGAAYLAAAAAQRCSIGAVFILAPPERVEYFQAQLPSAIVVECKSPREILNQLDDRKIRSIVAGPGWLEVCNDSGLLYEILAIDKPTVVDASALDALHAIRHKLPARKKAMVITPHQGELAKLFPELQAAHPLEAIRSAASELKASVLLKGFTTLIAASEGKIMFNINARAELAVAGSGDVLAGMIGALLCHYDDGYKVSNFAAWWHAAAGRGFGLVAEDIVNNLSKVAELELDS